MEDRKEGVRTLVGDFNVRTGTEEGSRKREEKEEEEGKKEIVER